MNDNFENKVIDKLLNKYQNLEGECNAKDAEHCKKYEKSICDGCIINMRQNIIEDCFDNEGIVRSLIQQREAIKKAKKTLDNTVNIAELSLGKIDIIDYWLNT